MGAVPGYCVSFSNFPPSTLERTIVVNHPQSPQLISFVCVQKNSPEVDLMSRSQSAATEKQIPVDTPPPNMLGWFPEPRIKHGEKCSAAEA